MATRADADCRSAAKREGDGQDGGERGGEGEGKGREGAGGAGEGGGRHWRAKSKSPRYLRSHNAQHYSMLQNSFFF